MNKLVNIREPAFYKQKDVTIEALLLYLDKFGRARLTRMDTGWHARVEVFVTGLGVDFCVKSEYKHSTPKESLLVCAERLDKALKELGVDTNV